MTIWDLFLARLIKDTDTKKRLELVQNGMGAVLTVWVLHWLIGMQCDVAGCLQTNNNRVVGDNSRYCISYSIVVLYFLRYHA